MLIKNTQVSQIIIEALQIKYKIMQIVEISDWLKKYIRLNITNSIVLNLMVIFYNY